MNITLNDSEIETALIEFVGRQGISLANKKIAVDFTAGRGANGNSATIEILPASDAPEVEPSNVVTNIKATDAIQQASPFGNDDAQTEPTATETTTEAVADKTALFDNE
jgi:hypothetical protein